jgi:Ca2+-binding RTX toxin-like protein
VTELAGAGKDTVISAVSYTLGTNVEALTLTGAGNLNGTGNSANNLITGNAGNNVLNGSTGTDTLLGGTGDDTYVVNTASDVVTEDADAGTDTVQSTASYTLSANLERLTLTGSTSVSATGNELDNVLTGNGGNNTLNGGAGTDTMTGGLGNDVYVLDVVTDVATELAGAGTDTLQVYFSHTLGETFERLTLLGAADLYATGNASANTLTGNAGNNVLDGAAGVDTMAGGAGNDTYYVESAGEVVTESSGAGTDEVISSVSFTLGSNIERLTLTGTGDLNGTGSSVANTITGTAGNNVLDGGSGNDTLIGGGGDDTYVVGSSGDVIVEVAGEGTDTVRSSTSHTLGATLEHLTLIGTGSLKGTGNAQSNAITGNQGNNTLDGGAGSDTLDGGLGADVLRGNAGSDTLTGGDGADLFLFDTALSGAGADLITDFAVGVDKIRLDDDVFTAFKATLTTLVTADQFVSGAGITAAQDAMDRLIYDTDTGALYYDPDGTGAQAGVQIAVLGASTHPALSAGDFVIVA